MCYSPKRLNVGIMLFAICLTSYMARVNFSINIVAMTVPMNASEPAPDYGVRYDWGQKEQGALLGAYFYGYFLGSFPAGALAENLGGKNVILISSALSAFFTAISPLSAMNIFVMFVVRLILGILGGVIYPCCHNLISKWAPPDEKGKFVASLLGGTFGTVITWPLSGMIIEHLGWEWAFYIIAMCILISAIAWLAVVEESPHHHTTITDAEREYIITALGNKLKPQKRIPPYAKMLMNEPFWALLILHYGSIWGLFFLITATPKFLSEVLHFDVTKAGFLSGLPHLSRFLCALIFGQLGDTFLRREWFTVTEIRKLFCVTSHILPGILLIVLAFYGREPYTCVAIMTLSLGLNGSTVCSNSANAQDLAPNFAGTVYGIINGVGTTAGFICPQIVGFLTADQSTFDEWKYIFLIGATFYIFPALIFWLIGSGEVQPWNEAEPAQDEK